MGNSIRSKIFPLKVSLVSPPISIIERYPENHPLRKGLQITEPLGLAYLAAMIQDLVEVEIIDCIAENLTINQCLLRLYDSDVIGISTVTSNINIVLDLAEKIRENFSNKLIILGGVHASLYPVQLLMKCKAIDLIVIGEGEYVLREIILGESPSLIKGLAYRSNNEIIVTESRCFEVDLDNFPFPARKLLKMNLYKPFLYLRKPVHSLISSRGCPFNCTYCCRDISGKNYRVRNVENVIEEIKILTDKNLWRSKEIAFQDPVFGLNRKWLQTFCERMIEEKLDVVWSALTRVHLVNESLLKLMKEAGCWMLYYGVEAGNQQLLNTIKKGITLNMVEKTVKTTNNAGIKSWGSFMFALPGETPELARETLDFAKHVPFDFASFHLTTPFKGTELEQNYSEWGTLSNNSEDYTQLNPVFIPFGWKNREKELEQFYIKAFKEFYFRPKYIIRQLLNIKSLNEIKMFIRGLKVV